MTASGRLGWRRRARLVARQAIDKAPPRWSLALVDAVEGRSEAELRLLPALADDVMTAVDIGANRGLYARRLARLCPRVIACEPQPALASRLVSATPPNVMVLPVALSATAGQTIFHIPLVGSVTAHTRGTLAHVKGEPGRDFEDIDIVRLRLDDLALDDVGLMKIDVEGHELDVLQGAADTLERCRPRLLVECEIDAGTDPEYVAKHLAPLGYDGWFPYGDTILPLDEFDADRHQPERKLVAGPAVPTRATNFLFLPSHEAERVVASLRTLTARR